jgi:hypothetical protein
VHITLFSHSITNRLDLDLPGIVPSQLFLLLEAISSLPNLEAFGCDVRSVTEIEDLGIISDYLPLTLSALHLQFCWENVSFTEPEMRPLLDRVAAMQMLELIHIQMTYGTNQETAEELAFALPSVDIVGLGAHFWNVERSGRRLRVKEWTAKQIVMRTADTIGAAGEW